MKKQNKIIIGLILGAAVIIILISFLFPSVYKGLSSGSFGKADKYRQEQMSENDIRLRSDFVQDTAKLRQMITGLIYYALFTENLSMTIDTCLTSFKLQGFDKSPGNAEAIHLLTDYSSFLKNNTPTIANTTRMLAAFLLRDTVAQSMDIEKNLKDFANYVNQVNQKDSVLTLSLAKIDAYLVGNKTLQKKDEEIRNLKAIRDQLVIKSTQFMALTGNKQGLGAMLSYTIQSQGQFSGVGALNQAVNQSQVVQSKISAAEVGSKVLSSTLCAGFSAASSLQSTLSSNMKAAGNLGSNAGTTDAAKVNLNIVIYDKANLSFAVGSAENLKIIYGKDNLGVVVGSAENLKVVNGKENLGLVVGSAENLKMYNGHGNLNGILCGTDPNLGALCVFYGKNLSVTLNAGLMANLNSSQALNGVLSSATMNLVFPAQVLSAAGDLHIWAFGSNAPLQMGYCGSQALAGQFMANGGLKSLLNSNVVFSGFNSLQATTLNSLMNAR